MKNLKFRVVTYKDPETKGAWVFDVMRVYKTGPVIVHLSTGKFGIVVVAGFE
jgi:hypothetical protein